LRRYHVVVERTQKKLAEMTLEMATQAISLIVAPVVMITSCAILISGLLTRYAAVNDRLRLLARERLDLLRTIRHAVDDAIDRTLLAERLDEIDHQVPELLGRHRLIRNSLMAVYLAVLLFIATMFVIALAVIVGAGWLTTLVLATFLAGMGALFLGILITAWEVRKSEHAIHYEVQRVMTLPEAQPDAEPVPEPGRLPAQRWSAGDVAHPPGS
jgi:hypothetical protein